jgi:hypothetical protein
MAGAGTRRYVPAPNVKMSTESCRLLPRQSSAAPETPALISSPPIGHDAPIARACICFTVRQYAYYGATAENNRSSGLESLTASMSTSLNKAASRCRLAAVTPRTCVSGKLAQRRRSNPNAAVAMAIVPRKALSGVKLQYISDMHLERIQYEYTIEPAAPYLLLLGDIGRFRDYDKYRAFLVSQCKQFEKVLLWAGNHEFYGSSHQGGKDIGAKLAAEPEMEGKLIFTDCHRFDVPDSHVTILGCTLWSHVPDDCQGFTNDISNITNWRRATHNAAHAEEVEWLRSSLQHVADEEKRRKVVIATHFAPSYEKTCHPQQTNNRVSPWFCSHLLKDLRTWPGKELVTHWLFGHTHWNAKFKSGKTWILSNHLCNGSFNLSWWQRHTLYRPFDPHAVLEL